MASNTMRIYVHSRVGMGAQLVKARFALGLEPDPSPYGFDLAERHGHHLTYSEDGRTSKFLTKLPNLKATSFVVSFIHALFNLNSMKNSDVIWTLLETEWSAISLLQKLRLAPKVPVIANTVWLFDSWTQRSWFVRAVWRSLMMKHLFLTVHSRRALVRAGEYLPEKEFQLSYFGISTRCFPISEPKVSINYDRPIRIYSIGDDGTRDWQTMLEAFGNDDRFDVTIVCRWISDEQRSGYTNLRVPRNVTVDDQRRFYKEADVVIMPMRENCFSGITVMCEAAAMGKPIIASDTGGADTYFGPDEVTYVPPGDPAALRNAVLNADPAGLQSKAERAQTRFVSNGYSAERMIGRYIAQSERLIQR